MTFTELAALAAGARAATEARPQKLPGELKLSELLRTVADDIDTAAACAKVMGVPYENAPLAPELRARATVLEAIDKASAERCGRGEDVLHRLGCPCEVLAQIGEVRS